MASRDELYEGALEVEASGLNHGSSGNISVREKSGFWITPSGVQTKNLNPDSMVFVNLEKGPKEGERPSSEWPFHQAVYRSRKDLNALVHTHSVNASSVAILGKSIPPIHYMVAVCGGTEVRCVPYATYGTQELSDHVVRGMEDRNAILMEHHGLLAGEKTLSRAIWVAREIEWVAECYLKLLPLGPVPTLRFDQMKAVIDKFQGYGVK